MKVLTALLALTLLAPLTAHSAHAAEDVIVLVDAHARPGAVDAVVAGFRRSQARCPIWQGCRRFEITISDSAPSHVVVIEQWDSIDAHKEQVGRVFAQASFREFRALLERDLAFRYLRLDRVEGAD